MTTTVDKILNEARKYIEVVEGSSRHHAIIDKYDSVKPLPQGYKVTYSDDWCDTFVSFLAIETNATDIIGRECGVERHINIFKNLGIWIEDGSIKPKPGDIITFHWHAKAQPNNGFGNHIGIVESVTNSTITTIEGNSANSVRRRQYTIGNAAIRGFARPRYQSVGGETSSSIYTGGALTNAGYTISQENIQLAIKNGGKYNIKPSFMIAQTFIESDWGNPRTSLTGAQDNNWSGISEPFKIPKDLNIFTSRGTRRQEGGYYVHFNTMNDYFKAYAFVLSHRNGLYNVENTKTIEAFCKGLFTIGGAKANYAASGYQGYFKMLIPTYNAIKRQNPGKLEAIDASAINTDGDIYVPEIDDNTGKKEDFTRIHETGTFYPNTTINVRDYPSTSGKKVAEYTAEGSLIYDSYVINEGYVWLSYISRSGARRYIAWRVKDGKKFGSIA